MLNSIPSLLRAVHSEVRQFLAEHSHHIHFIAPRLLPYHLRIGFRLVNELQTGVFVLTPPVVPSGLICQYSDQLGISPNNSFLELGNICFKILTAYFEERFLCSFVLGNIAHAVEVRHVCVSTCTVKDTTCRNKIQTD